MFDRSKLESLRDVSVTRISDAFSYGFPQTVYAVFTAVTAVLLDVLTTLRLITINCVIHKT